LFLFSFGVLIRRDIPDRRRRSVDCVSVRMEGGLESLVPRLDAGLLELFDPATGELVFSELVREPTSSAVLAIH
jgi:hypothetical protein